MNFFDLLQHLNESPDDIYLNAPKKSIYTFIYDTSVENFIKNLLTQMKKRFKIKPKEIKYLKDIFKKYVENKLKINLNNPIMIISGSNGKVYINNKLESSKKGVKYLTHNALIEFFIVDALEYSNADEDDIKNYEYYNYKFSRYIGKSGRITTSTKKKEWPLISLWSVDISNSELNSLMGLSNKIINYPDKIHVELNPLKNKHYQTGEVYEYSTTDNKSKVKASHHKTDDVIDAVRKRMFPDVESIQEGIDNKLKEEVYKIFDKKFKDSLNFSKEQPSLPATKYVIEKIADSYPIEGRFKNYKYYFAIKNIDNIDFVIDLGNNMNGKIIPIIEPLNGSEYTITKKFTIQNFLKAYDKLKTKYN